MANVQVVTEGSFSCHGEIFRPVKEGFKPDLWGDVFTSYNLQKEVALDQLVKDINALKEEVRSMLMMDESKIKEKIILIDTIERLGLSYHFEKEIDEQLKQIFDELTSNVTSGDENNDGLFNTSLQFRLLRQHGYNISCSVFEKFKDKDDKFVKTLNSDIEGLLSFYEASELRFEGEDILEEGVAYTTHHLNRVRFMLDSPLRDKVSQALTNSVHKGIPILEARRYISTYEKERTKNQLLLKLAKLNFQFLQNLYKKELCDLSRWWKESDLPSKLPYMRSRLVECYLWALTSHIEPEYSFARSAFAKSIVLVSLIDDTIDTYGTLDELDIFIQALQRWDIKEIDRLPEYMKIIYKFFLNVYEEVELEAFKQGRSYAVSYAIEAMKQIIQAYHTQAHWYKKKRVPTFEDALPTAIITSSAFALVTASFIGFDFATKQEFDWMKSQPKIAVAAARIGRFMNDIASYQRESENGQTNAIDYYMKQHGVSKQEAVLKLVEIIEDSWMTINKECLETTSIPKQILKQILNFARASHVYYMYGDDGFTNQEMTLKPHIVALFVDPIIN